jgi:hypothetical protein
MQSGFEILVGTAISENQTAETVSSVYPNPVQNISSVLLKDQTVDEKRITVFNSLGEICLEKYSKGPILLDRKNLRPGIYRYRIESADRKKIWIGKFAVMD